MSDTSTHPKTDGSPERMLTLRGGGWVILLALGLTFAVLVWGLAGVLTRDEARGGAARSVDQFGFDLSTAIIPVDQIVVGSEGKDFIRALDHPRMIDPAEVERINKDEYGKYLVTTDRVIGVEINGEVRAYPLRMLDWHEVVNDTVGGVPIAVTYNGLCDSAVVFDRRAGGETLAFGVSGLLYNSNLLLYDRRPDAVGESLWSQLQARAVTGPAATRGDRLSVLACALVSWGAWRAMHPETVVLEKNPDPSLERYYQRRTYGEYFGSDILRFPAAPLPEDGRALKTQIVAVLVGDSFHAFAVRDVAQRAGEDRIWETSIEDVPLRFTVFDDPLTVLVTAGNGEPARVIYSFWFGWYATHPEAVLE